MSLHVSTRVMHDIRERMNPPVVPSRHDIIAELTSADIATRRPKGLAWFTTCGWVEFMYAESVVAASLNEERWEASISRIEGNVVHGETHCPAFTFTIHGDLSPAQIERVMTLESANWQPFAVELPYAPIAFPMELLIESGLFMGVEITRGNTLAVMQTSYGQLESRFMEPHELSEQVRELHDALGAYLETINSRLDSADAPIPDDSPPD